MLILFEVVMVPGSNPDEILSEETRKETSAQVMTLAECQAMGFQGLSPDPKGREVRYVAVNSNDRQWILRMLEAHEGVHGYKIHEIGD